MKKLVRSTCLTIVFVLSVYIGRSLCDESRMEDYDPVERILRERGLKSPHEVKNTRQPLWEHHGKDVCFNISPKHLIQANLFALFESMVKFDRLIDQSSSG